MAAFVLMGVSGAGKSTIGQRVAAQLGLPFIEGDDFHPPANMAKMSSGIPLTDADRMPWIDALARGIEAQPRRDRIVAASALSKAVRKRLRDAVSGPVHFIFLTAAPEVIARRLATRPRHFMKAGMLDSQLATLELPENAVQIDVDRPIAAVVQDVARYVRERLDERASH